MLTMFLYQMLLAWREVEMTNSVSASLLKNEEMVIQLLLFSSFLILSSEHNKGIYVKS